MKDFITIANCSYLRAVYESIAHLPMLLIWYQYAAFVNSLQYFTTLIPTRERERDRWNNYHQFLPIFTLDNASHIRPQTYLRTYRHGGL